jgi:CelD/BcsL family acetyltransferase involved in cellulose biosynthesis
MPEPVLRNVQDELKSDEPTPALPPVHFADLEISVTSNIRKIESAWRRLETRNWNTLNQSMDWCLSWAQSQGTELVALTGARGREIFFILPLDITTEKAGRIARWPGARFNNTNSGLFDEHLAPPDDDEIEHLRRSIKAVLHDRADLLTLDQVPLVWRGVDHPLAPLASIENQNHSFQLPLADTMEATLKQLNAKARRKKFRVQSRRMEELGGYDHVHADDPQEQAKLLDLFFAQKGARLRANGLPDVFAPSSTRAFLHCLLAVPRKPQAWPLVMHAIRLKGEHAGHIAAIAGLSRKGDHVLCQFSSIDDSIAGEASPGEFLFWLMIEHSIGEGAKLFDFGIGDQPYKRSWCSGETVLQDILLPLTARGRLLQPLMLGKTAIKARLKQHPRIYAIIQRWRRNHSAAA